MAPELWKRKAHSMKVDCWAVGVIAFQLISGKFPFIANDRKTLGRKISLEEPNYCALRYASYEAHQFIEACLVKDPDMRPSVESLL